jgi:16S rRNA (guanine527-N7)-methyltransferase
MKTKFQTLVKNINIELDNEQLELFASYYKELIEWNKKMNLTAITQEEDVYVKHFYDSLCFSKISHLSSETLLDVGSGAGFPSIPLLIAFPNLKVTIIDAQQKRIKFLEALLTKLGLKAKLIHGRAEDFQFKNHFDLVTARAVSNLQILTELCLPFARVGGKFVALKGPSYQEELDLSKHAISLLGGKVGQVLTYEYDDQFRSLIEILKIEKTKSLYPRKFNKIKNNPL